MAKMVVELSWNDKVLGPMWMNIDNLYSLLYSNARVNDNSLKVKEISHSAKNNMARKGKIKK